MSLDNFSSLFRQFGYGDRAKFFMQMEFVRDPEPDTAPPEESASWGRLQIWAGGRNLCLHYVDGLPQESVTWQLLPVLEWLAKDWDYLLHEQRYPTRNVAGPAGIALRSLNSPENFEGPKGWNRLAAKDVDDWTRRHSLLMHRNGGIFPDVWLRRLSSQIEISWTADHPPGAPRGFRFNNGDGNLLLTPHDVAEPLYAVLKEASAALSSALPQSARLKKLVEQVDAIKDGRRADLRVSILAALGRTPVEWRTHWKELSKAIWKQYKRNGPLISDFLNPQGNNGIVVGGECAAALMFGSACPDLKTEDALFLAGLLLAQEETPDDALLRHARNEPLDPHRPPWKQGYALAQEWTVEEREPDNRNAVDIESHLERQGVVVKKLELSDSSIGAVSMARKGKRPIIAVNWSNPRNKSPRGRRFTLAHELCHLLYDRNRGVDFHFVSGEWAPIEIEKRANAFAAGLLMADELVLAAAREKNITLAKLDGSKLTALARQLDVSPSALDHHLANRGWIRSRILVDENSDY
jgi:Zn-dependent peptidase ImmA (M78 family)